MVTATTMEAFIAPEDSSTVGITMTIATTTADTISMADALSTMNIAVIISAMSGIVANSVFARPVSVS